MITDLQGVGYNLCDAEIATQTIVKEKSDKSKMFVKPLCCVGNLSTTAFKNFERERVCNTYCIKLERAQLQGKNCILNCIPKIFYLFNARIQVKNELLLFWPCKRFFFYGKFYIELSILYFQIQVCINPFISFNIFNPWYIGLKL